jgi:A/G-specific adenine glycosylase
VLVSELMLQQTQVSTVIPYFNRWMDQFPTARHLAEAHEDTVHKAWEGLGYYRRARFLKAAAGSVAAEGWPGDLEGLCGLPGLGPYTSAALGAIAFQWPTAALDGNAFRVLSRLLLIEEDPKAKARELRAWLVPALEALGPSRLTQAIMELGATVCSPTPACGACPLQAHCGAHGAGRTGDIPPVAKRPQPKPTALWLLALEAEGGFLLREPAPKGLLAGLWRWPTLEGDEVAPLANGPLGEPLRAWPGWTQVYTHRREQVSPLHLHLQTRFEAGAGHRWIPKADLGALPLGKRDQRLRDLLQSDGEVPLEAPSLAACLRACGAPAG